MATPHADETVEIVLDQPRRLFFNLRALRALDRSMGEIGIAKVLDLIRALNFATLERALWAGLLHDEPTLTVALVAKRIDTMLEAGGTADALFEAAYRAVNGSGVFGKPEGEARPEVVTQA